MGRYFSDVVDKALEDIYYCYDNDRAKAALAALQTAAAAGDGDAESGSVADSGAPKRNIPNSSAS